MFIINNLRRGVYFPPFNTCLMYDVDFYTHNGTIIHNECHSLDEVFNLVSESIDSVQLVNIQKNEN